jgi:hypothetical protein
MAIDETLLRDAVENGVATLRFYQWSEPTLSLGYFQRYDDRAQHAASRDYAVVRRQSGGGAILHDRELTYSVVLPASHPFARQAGGLYEAVHNAFITALACARPPDNARSTLRIRGGAESPSPNEPFLCFQRQSPGDVILVLDGHNAAAVLSSPTGWPSAGSAAPSAAIVGPSCSTAACYWKHRRPPPGCRVCVTSAAWNLGSKS